MYYYRDTERNIPNTFAPDIIENEDFCIPEIIAFLDEGFMKRDDIPADILKRVDAEIKFINETQVEETQIKKTFMIENEFKNDVL